MKKIILVDFDGVIHSYTSGWKGARVVADPPVRGAIGWLFSLVCDPRFEVCIYSSRSRQWGGKRAMRAWLKKHAGNIWYDSLAGPGLEDVKFPTKKPAAFLTIDDRCVCFNGKFWHPDDIDTFKPWNKQGV
jgi:hypothetical protein